MVKFFSENMLKKLRGVGKKHRVVFIILIAAFSIALLLIAVFNFYFLNKIFPGITVAGISVSRKSIDEAARTLENQAKVNEKVTLVVKDRSFDMSLKEVGFTYDYKSSAESAYRIYRSNNFWRDILESHKSPFKSKNLSLKTKIDSQKLNEYLHVVSTQVAVEPTNPSVSLKNGEVVIHRGSKGEDIDPVLFRDNLEKQLSNLDFSPIELPLQSIDKTINDEKAALLKARAERLLGKSLNLSYEYTTVTVKGDSLLGVIDPHDSYNNDYLSELIKTQIAPKVDREPQNAVFKFEQGKVMEFLPAKNGVTVNNELLKEQLIEKISLLENSEDKILSLDVPVQTAPPSVTTDQVNNLGIKELLGSGVSKFRGSIPGRIHNIGLASSKFNGVLIAPGETFSFNDIVGDVSAYTGYKQAYIIKDGRTVLGDGGGVCQVSTTLFRAALKAGLPIIERRAHSYRVGYYEQDSPPGLDATVFSPTTDLKIKNDTPAHILIQTVFNSTDAILIFEIYGTSDGRIATTTKPVITSSISPPEDLYIDDPNLPTGTVKQIEYKAWGAKVVYDYKVTRGEETIFEKNFISNFRPWQAVFLKGTGPTN